LSDARGETAPPPPATAAKPLRGWRLLAAALRNRKLGVMLAFGFSAGLPYALLLGTLYAWLGEAQVDLETMGVFSLIGLAYAFKFLWSPIVDRVALPGLEKLGRRRSWLLPIQFALGIIFITLSSLNPQTSLGWFSLLAGFAAFASATQDIVIDAWRIDVADETATLEILSAVYQLGYRIAALVGGALALIAAARVGWPEVYFAMGVIMLLIAAVTLLAPDTARPAAVDPLGEAAFHRTVPLRAKRIAMAVIGSAWAWALLTVIAFMVSSLGATADARPDATAFIKFYGPLIVIATVVVPAIVAAILNGLAARQVAAVAADGSLDRGVGHAYRALVLPLAEIVGRLRWAAFLALGLILTYRLTDAIWGPFALPFYLQELQYSNDEVAIASKFFGVGMTMAGIALGAVLFALVGRMPTLLLGAIVAAATNLLYADLAQGGAGLDVFGRMSGFYALAEYFGSDERFSRLLLAIAGENLAGGLAGAAFVAYLSSITSRDYSAVQYALLSSLTFLVGSLGRGAIGEAIDVNGYAPVFYFTAALGTIAVALCIAEWIRISRQTPGVATARKAAG
jgi:MFS transporter, PAT family, beta-lactamase induction signal transducer AmpG